MGLEVCDRIAQECYDVPTALIAVGLVVYGLTVMMNALGRRLAELAPPGA